MVLRIYEVAWHEFVSLAHIATCAMISCPVRILYIVALLNGAM